MRRWSDPGVSRGRAGVDVASLAAAVVAKMVRLVATNLMQASDGPCGRYGSSAALEGGVRTHALEAARQN